MRTFRAVLRKVGVHKLLSVLFLLLVVYAVLSIWIQARTVSMQAEPAAWPRLQQQQQLHDKNETLSTGTSFITKDQFMTTDRQLYYPGKRVVWPPPKNDSSRPPLNHLIEDNEIIGDVQFLLDFAIVGFGKCGTSTLMEFFAAIPQVAIFSREVYDLVRHQPAQLVQSLYQDLPAGNAYIRGYKNPLEVAQSHVLQYYRTLFPRTRLIIGMRHPIRWFESLYNFRVQNLPPNQEMPHPNHLVGRCYPDRMNTCTEKGNFAYALMQLGKTNEETSRPMSPLAQEIVGHFSRLWFNVSKVPYLPNPVFLYHLEQMHETPETFTRDVAAFIGLDGPLPALPHRKPGIAIINETLQQAKQEEKIDICDAEYRPVRAELLRIGSLGSRWIENEFLTSSTSVFVSDPSKFRDLLRQWSVDPCGSTTDSSMARPKLRPPRNDPIIRGVLPFRVSVAGGKD